MKEVVRVVSCWIYFEDRVIRICWFSGGCGIYMILYKEELRLIGRVWV